jgi:succinate dehydrogenase / fumarate reductase cytochrome b subunit
MSEHSSSSFLRSFSGSSIGKKQIMALTGFALCGFLLMHLLGNLLLLAGPEAFNYYAYQLTSTPLIYVAEAILVVIFLTHLVCAAKLFLQNKQARPVAYAAKKNTGRGTTFASASMPYTGMIILIFLILHLFQFKYGEYYVAMANGIEVRDIYRTVIEYFDKPFNVIWYVVAMIALSIHLTHGVQSMFQSLGLRHPKYTPCIKLGSLAFAIVIPLGFAALSIWCHFQSIHY